MLADGFVQPEVFPSATFLEGPWARTGGNAASVPPPKPSQSLCMGCVLCSQAAEAFQLPQQMQPWINFCAALITVLLIANNDSNVFIAVNPLFICLR